MDHMGAAKGWLMSLEPLPMQCEGKRARQEFAYTRAADVDPELAVQFALGRAIEHALSSMT
jgi:hypothetical protein